MKKGVVTLRSLEMAGFKSFAKRTKLEFGEGLIAIVGPNGSGKSNIVDAIKWVFGEQKTKSLRTERAEDLIYHGNNGKARASMAEVVISLDNSSGKIPVELNEIEITRRLYRSGESNYLLNGKKVSLGAIQELLAKSGFGVGSYTVVGQGLIDKLILASGQERKQLFEEASGIKQYEIKQSQTRKKIDATKQNLEQINAMIKEYSPLQANLAREAELLAKRQQLTQQLNTLRTNYISIELTNATKQKNELHQKLSGIETELAKINQQISALEKQHKGDMVNTNKNSVNQLSADLVGAEKRREELETQITKLTVELEQSSLQRSATLENIASIENQIREVKQNLSSHHKSQAEIQKHINKYEAKLSLIDEKVKKQTGLLDATRTNLGKSQKTEYLRHSLGLIDVLQASIEAGKSKDQLAVVFFKLRRMIRHSITDDSAELALKVGRIQNNISALLGEREKIAESQTNEIIKLRANELDEASLKDSLGELGEQLKNTQKLLSEGKVRSAEKIEAQLSKLEQQKSELLGKIAEVNKNLAELAGAQDSATRVEYFAKHEQLSNKQIMLEQQASSVDSNLREAEEAMARVQDLQNEWFKTGFKPVKHPVKVDINKIRSIEAELGVLQDIDPTTDASYKELAGKLDYLHGQSKDLQKALANLEAVLAGTQKEMLNQFKQGFFAINKNFGSSFKKLFGGGEASLELTSEADGFGIEIMVRLPNKRAQNLSSLSGGEKALASAALLAGILASNPSPFVVLDEVDAALDETNTKKFAELLTSITDHSQVLVVTHNHDTMAVADELLGVTTTGNNESHIIRVQLDSLPAAVTR